jgi:hypothetical protein
MTCPTSSTTSSTTWPPSQRRLSQDTLQTDCCTSGSDSGFFNVPPSTPGSSSSNPASTPYSHVTDSPYSVVSLASPQPNFPDLANINTMGLVSIQSEVQRSLSQLPSSGYVVTQSEQRSMSQSPSAVYDDYELEQIVEDVDDMYREQLRKQQEDYNDNLSVIRKNLPPLKKDGIAGYLNQTTQDIADQIAKNLVNRAMELDRRRLVKKLRAASSSALLQQARREVENNFAEVAMNRVTELITSDLIRDASLDVANLVKHKCNGNLGLIGGLLEGQESNTTTSSLLNKELTKLVKEIVQDLPVEGRVPPTFGGLYRSKQYDPSDPNNTAERYQHSVSKASQWLNTSYIVQEQQTTISSDGLIPAAAVIIKKEPKKQVQPKKKKMSPAMQKRETQRRARNKMGILMSSLKKKIYHCNCIDCQAKRVAEGKPAYLEPIDVEEVDLGFSELPDSIPMPRKKTRGRPRKYPRLDDVLRYKNSLVQQEQQINDGGVGVGEPTSFSHRLSTEPDSLTKGRKQPASGLLANPTIDDVPDDLKFPETQLLDTSTLIASLTSSPPSPPLTNTPFIKKINLYQHQNQFNNQPPTLSSRRSSISVSSSSVTDDNQIDMMTTSHPSPIATNNVLGGIDGQIIQEKSNQPSTIRSVKKRKSDDYSVATTTTVAVGNNNVVADRERHENKNATPSKNEKAISNRKSSYELPATMVDDQPDIVLPPSKAVPRLKLLLTAPAPANGCKLTADSILAYTSDIISGHRMTITANIETSLGRSMKSQKRRSSTLKEPTSNHIKMDDDDVEGHCSLLYNNKLMKVASTIELDGPKGKAGPQTAVAAEGEAIHEEEKGIHTYGSNSRICSSSLTVVGDNLLKGSSSLLCNNEDSSSSSSSNWCTAKKPSPQVVEELDTEDSEVECLLVVPTIKAEPIQFFNRISQVTTSSSGGLLRRMTDGGSKSICDITTSSIMDASSIVDKVVGGATNGIVTKSNNNGSRHRSSRRRKKSFSRGLLAASHHLPSLQHYSSGGSSSSSRKRRKRCHCHSCCSSSSPTTNYSSEVISTNYSNNYRWDSLKNPDNSKEDQQQQQQYKPLIGIGSSCWRGDHSSHQHLNTTKPGPLSIKRRRRRRWLWEQEEVAKQQQHNKPSNTLLGHKPPNWIDHHPTPKFVDAPSTCCNQFRRTKNSSSSNKKISSSTKAIAIVTLKPCYVKMDQAKAVYDAFIAVSTKMCHQQKCSPRSAAAAVSSESIQRVPPSVTFKEKLAKRLRWGRKKEEEEDQPQQTKKVLNPTKASAGKIKEGLKVIQLASADLPKQATTTYELSSADEFSDDDDEICWLKPSPSPQFIVRPPLRLRQQCD